MPSFRSLLRTLPGLLIILATLSPASSQTPPVTFLPQVLSEDFFSEGACFADIDADGHQDVISGPFWYPGPDFTTRHAYAPADRFPIAVYSRHFFSFAHDFNADDRIDILVIPMPGQPAHWFENPGEITNSPWRQHLACHDVGNESPAFTDLTGDGQPELVFCHQGKLGYAEPNWQHPEQPWRFNPITEDRGYGHFTHGLGVGDVNGDGRPDVLETHGWWQQPQEKGALFLFHPVRFAENGGAQMFTDDVDGDGDQDVISVQNAHGYGLCWFEQLPGNPEPAFKRHHILTDKPSDNPYGLSISQMHAAALVDIDGDGRRDLVTGKRFWAHGGADPGAQELPVLYWFQNLPGENGVHFRPWLIDTRSGVGTQLTVGDIDGDRRPDILVGNKLGTFVLLQAKQNTVTANATLSPAQAAGTPLFAEQVRSTEALSPTDEAATFILPHGFQIDLVAAEPDIAKPMNLAFDHRGRLWVSSSLEYPYAAPSDRPAKDTIKILEDLDGDGRADKITTFADNLNIPMGLLPYGDGVICFSIPSILYLRDTDGDDRADVRQTLYGPFDTTRDTHGMCNAFTRGLDGWIYACHGFNNQSTVSGADGHSITMQSGNTFRFRPDGSRIEHVGFGQVNPFGMTFDAGGDLFTADCHTKPINLILPGGYHDSFGKPHDGLGYVPNIMEHLHGSTGIAGIALGEATHFPQAYCQSSFGGNVVTSRINHNRLLTRGSTIVAEEASDFLISGDPWFRPVDLKVGPDGALYVADFYNCIIGHYEVPLTHPRRDRFRGRIWRISYRGNPSRQPAASPNVDHIIQRLAEANATESGHLLDQLAAADPAQTLPAIRQALQEPLTDVNTRIHLLWALSRAGNLTDGDVATAADLHQPENLRRHAYHLLRAAPSLTTPQANLVVAALTEESPPVRRAAILAAAAHPSTRFINHLLAAHRELPADDVHALHAVKIALKAHLFMPETWDQLHQQDLQPSDLNLLADVCLAVKDEAAGRFMVNHLSDLEQSRPENLVPYLRFAARAAPAETLSRGITVARNQEPTLQRELLLAIGEGLSQRGIDITQDRPDLRPLRDWASELARTLLGNASAQPVSLPWTPGSGVDETPWTTSRRRASEDGLQETLLWSSFPKGEERTGTFRSAPFTLGTDFHFYLAGHDGPPGQHPRGHNHVSLRAADTHEILRQIPPPGQDVARLISWDTADLEGRQVYVELCDADDGPAYAWLAAGRFSFPALNPDPNAGDQPQGALLVETFRLTNLRPLLTTLLRSPSAPHSAAAPALAQALTTLQEPPSTLRRTLAFALKLPLLQGDLRERSVRILIETATESDEALLADLFQEWMQALPRDGQKRLAERLSADPLGASLLLRLAREGQASAYLLQIPTIEETLRQTLDSTQQKAMDDLLSTLPDADVAAAELVADRIQHYRQSQGGDPALGQTLFTQHCAACHQVGGSGTTLGPNLDGIGNRGLDRLTEDVLDPNRNVDVAFRLTTITTKGGQTHIGLVKGTEGAQLLMADPAGNTFAIPSADVLTRSELNLSLMPATFGQAIPADQFTHLQAYLLSLTKG